MKGNHFFMFQHCQLTIMDDDMNPVLEGNETFTVFLSSAIRSNLIEPYIATVVIKDSHLDGKCVCLKLSFKVDKFDDLFVSVIISCLLILTLDKVSGMIVCLICIQSDRRCK